MFLYRVFAVASLTVVLLSGTALGAQAPYQIVVSRDQQSLVVYDGDTVVATSKVSTGKKGHTTPTGIFSILEKRRFHKSNIYSNAPMPFMQRLTWSGIALHASNHVPSYPASHGCVRLPNDFAKTLFKMTERGLHVVISGRQVTPEDISHPLLFQPRKEPEAPPILLSDAEFRPAMSQIGSGVVEIAMTEPSPDAKVEKVEDTRPPLRILITRRTPGNITHDVQMLLNDLGHDAGIADGHAGQQTTDAIRVFQTAQATPPDGKITPELVEALYRKAGKAPPPNGLLQVRRSFKPLFEAPVTISRPEQALGTHFFQFQDLDAVTGKGKWFALTLDNVLGKSAKNRLGITMDNDPLAFNATQALLSRLTIAPDVREKLETLLVEGSSMTISDTGTTAETGLGTDFITITQTQ